MDVLSKWSNVHNILMIFNVLKIDKTKSVFGTKKMVNV